MVSPASSEDHPVNRIYLTAYLILASTLIPVIISIYCLYRGVIDIFPHLFYIPIILIAYAYPRKGIYGSVVIGGIYLTLVYLFAYPDIAALGGATTRFFFFVAIGSVITLLVRKMRDEEEKYHGIFDHAQDGVFLLSPDAGRIIDANPMAAGLVACAPGDLSGRDFSLLWEDPATMESFRKRIGEAKSVAGLEGRVRCTDGKVRDALISAGVLPDGKIACTVADITDRIEAARAVERERQELLDIIEFLPDATFVIDREKRVIAWNRAIEVMTGVPKADVLGKGDHAYSVPFYGEGRPAIVDFIFGEAPELEGRYEWVRREGASIYAENFIPVLRNGVGAHLWVKASPIMDRDGNLAGAIETIRDITDRRMAEEVLRESEANYRTVFNGANDAIAIYDLETRRFVEVNQKAAEMFGYSPEEFTRFGFEDMTAGSPPFTREDALLKIQDLWQDIIGGKPQLIEWLARDRAGKTFWVEMNLKMATIWGEPRVLAVVRDITARKLAEEALKASEANYREIFSAVNEGIFTIDPANGRILDANAKAGEMYDRPVEEFRGLGMDALSDAEHGYNLEGGQEVFTRAAAGEAQGFEWRAKDRTGRLFWVEVNVKRAIIGGEDRLLAVVRDITVRKQTEDIARIQHKLAERLGQVVGMDDAFRIATDALVRVEGIDASFACTLDDADHGFHPSHLHGFPLSNPPPLTCTMPPDLERELAAGNAAYLHTRTADPHIAGIFSPAGIRAMALLPILAEKKVIAVLVGCSKTLDEFPSLTKNGLETIGHQVGVNIARIRGREALEKSEALYRAVVEVQAEMISRFRPDGTHLFANEAYLRFFSKERADLIGKHFIPPIPDPDATLVKKHFASLTRENPVGTIEHRVILPGGGIAWMQWTDRAIFDKEGVLTEFQSVGRDITATKMMEEVERKAYAQIEKNIEQLAILGDHIRNPLTVIVGIADLDGGPTSSSIIQQARIIDQIITQLDRGWIESEKIREFLKKNDGNRYFR
ncbi:MAG TPA: PAS domain S-box protein [Methanomicrobiales archaeon]|nr:PAS domain S-box protein [Methanomicrobiales archaeon]